MCDAGERIARMVQGSKFNNVAYTHKDFPKYWSPHYRLEATVALENLIEATMNEKLFKKITTDNNWSLSINEDEIINIIDKNKKYFKNNKRNKWLYNPTSNRSKQC